MQVTCQLSVSLTEHIQRCCGSGNGTNLMQYWDNPVSWSKYHEASPFCDLNG